MSLLIFDDEMYHFLHFAQRDSIIAALFLQGDSSHINDEGNYIKRSSDEIDVVSFLPKSKYEKVEDNWENGRVKIKIGRFVKKFLTEFSFKNFKVTDALIEKFVNLYKSYFSRDISKLKIVEGNDILKYYLEDNYHTLNGGRAGSLWNSCMRQRERNKFMTLYAKNSDKVKMLVFFSDDDKVRARALLWEGVKDHKDSTKEYKFMDRIYYYYDHDINFFKDWAKENGYLCKWEQSAKTEMLFDDGTGSPVRKQLYVMLDEHNLSYYPYLDTFKFFNFEKGRFSNSDSYNFDYILVQSSGAVEREREPDEDEEMLYFDEDENEF
jgi:hypothetical protein